MPIIEIKKLKIVPIIDALQNNLKNGKQLKWPDLLLALHQVKQKRLQLNKFPTDFPPSH